MPRVRIIQKKPKKKEKGNQDESQCTWCYRLYDCTENYHLRYCKPYKKADLFGSLSGKRKRGDKGKESNLAGRVSKASKVIGDIQSITGEGSRRPSNPTCETVPDVDDMAYDSSNDFGFQELSPDVQPLYEENTIPAEVSGGWTKRKTRVPRHYDDYLPTSATPLSVFGDVGPVARITPEPEPSPTPGPDTSNQNIRKPRIVLSQPNEFGLVRAYSQTVSHDSEADVTLENLCDDPSLINGDRARRTFNDINPELVKLYGNWSIAATISWFVRTSQGLLTPMSMDEFFRDVVSNPKFDSKLLGRQSFSSLLKRLESLQTSNDIWHKSTLLFPLPCETVSLPEAKSPTYELEVQHRKLIPLIKSVLQSPSTKNIHFIPHKVFRIPPGVNLDLDAIAQAAGETPLSEFDIPGAQRVYGEAYTSDVWIRAHEDLRAQLDSKGGTGDNFEVAICGLQFSSDSLLAANFGGETITPEYVTVLNIDKNVRGRPSIFTHHQAAFMPSMGADFQTVYHKAFGCNASKNVMKLLRRDIHNGTVDLLLDDEFLHAYEHGVLIQCSDGIIRRIFPRVFVYSADYPEKAVLACIKNLGSHPCPSCYVNLEDIWKIGMDCDESDRSNWARKDTEYVQHTIDKTRKKIFEKHISLASTKVEEELNFGSLVPTRSPFSEKLSCLGLDVYTLFLPDIMHEFDLGVWKAVFCHLLLIIHDAGKINEMNQHYCECPSFGRHIRPIHKNPSSAKQLAARDYEDLLQLSISVFEGLLPGEHNEMLMDLLFTLNKWMSLAKLRSMTEELRLLLKEVTSLLGEQLRIFATKICPYYKTKDLPHDETSRLKKKNGPYPQRIDKEEGIKKFNLNCYKIHALIHYANTICNYGTTDSYSTQLGETNHKFVKASYARTNKRDYEPQLAKQEQRLRTVCMGIDPIPKFGRKFIDPHERYWISDRGVERINIKRFSILQGDDSRFETFIPDLYDHLLDRINDVPYNGGEDCGYTDVQRSKIHIKDGVLHRHMCIRLNYTTYDVRRSQDCINPKKNAYIMLRSCEDGEGTKQYWYAEVLGIFHVIVQFGTPRTEKRIDLLWVRWMGYESQHESGFKERRLPRLAYIQENDDTPCYGFLNPQLALRGVHVTPAFFLGHLNVSKPNPFLYSPKPVIEYRFYNVNWFADRDLFMWHRGGGVGHKNIWDIENKLLSDRGMQESTNEWINGLFKDFLSEIPQGAGEDIPLDAPIVTPSTTDLNAENLDDGDVDEDD